MLQKSQEKAFQSEVRSQLPIFLQVNYLTYLEKAAEKLLTHDLQRAGNTEVKKQIRTKTVLFP